MTIGFFLYFVCISATDPVFLAGSPGLSGLCAAPTAATPSVEEQVVEPYVFLGTPTEEHVLRAEDLGIEVLHVC